MGRPPAPPIPSKRGSPPSTHSSKLLEILEISSVNILQHVLSVACAYLYYRIGVKAMVEKVGIFLFRFAFGTTQPRIT